MGRYKLDFDLARISIEKYKCPTGAHKERVSQPSNPSHTVSGPVLTVQIADILVVSRDLSSTQIEITVCT